MKIQSAVSLLTLCALCAGAPPLYQPTATLYTGRGCTGTPSRPITAFVTDLRDYGFSNRAVSVQLLGTWLFYDNIDFNANGDALMEFSFEPVSSCVNFKDLSGALSSMRYAGHADDYRLDSITFFEGTHFQGHEEFVTRDLPNLALNGKITSLIITGSADWTIYDGPNYQGKAICLRKKTSPVYDPAFIPDTTELEPTVPHGAISSVRIGCHTNVQRFDLTGVFTAFTGGNGIHGVHKV